jgi:predicted nucleotidyltransferase
MPKLQKEFIDFHDNIKLGTYDENQTLRDKRDLLIGELKAVLKDEKIPDTDKALTFTTFGQGSYAMHTGITPSDSDYDIDVGIAFDIQKEDYPPVKLKRLIREKLKHENRTVLIRRPCITIKYAAGYHVDLAVYADNSDDYHIAWGKESSADPTWEKSEPKKLIDWVKEISTDAKARLQYRRCVRYLKAWKEKHFSGNGNAMPPSIGLTIQAGKWFSYREDSDLDTLISIISHIFDEFADEYHEDSDSWKKSIKACLPVEPFNDVYDQMTLIQTHSFHEKIDALLEALETARDEDDAHEASKILRSVFGDKFTLVEKEEARISNQKPYVTTGKSA